MTVTGDELAFGATPDGWQLSWRALEAGVQVIRVKLGHLGPDVVTMPEIEGLTDFVEAYDPVTDTLSIVIEAPAGPSALLIKSLAASPGD